jgi:hypothetical protein
MDAWIVRFEDEFEQEFRGLSQGVQDELLAAAKVLAEYGPRLGRPYGDTLKGSKHFNMKELRFDAAGGVWRMAFAFDPHRQATLLAAGDKSGVSQARFYKQLIAKADKRFAAHLERLKKATARRR